VRADLGGLLEHRDRDLAERLRAPRGGFFLVPFQELREAERAGEARGPSADEEHVDFETSRVSVISRTLFPGRRPRSWVACGLVLQLLDVALGVESGHAALPAAVTAWR